ncbi:hypothetical protein ACJRO7_006387 [Eucalyptus globulus]|uniref:Uncharacterized protein n=1 Tax=Eucalyptus globulus TaxID=34317 RepID=A0ABD3IHP9_EUCGL
MDKKKSKLVGIGDDGQKEIRIERKDEFGQILTPKEAFQLLSRKFHGKGPGKMKQEKRMKQYQEELKLKQMKNSDTPSLIWKKIWQQNMIIYQLESKIRELRQHAVEEKDEFLTPANEEESIVSSEPIVDAESKVANGYIDAEVLFLNSFDFIALM